MYLRKMVLIGLILYIVPNAVSFLIFRAFSWLIQPHNSDENALYAYCIYIALIIFSFLGGLIVAWSGKQRSWGVRFFFAIITLIHFLPIMIILAPIGALIIWLQNVISRWATTQFRIKITNSKIGCTVTSILASVSMFAGQLYVVERGNVKTARNIGKAVFAVHHLSSGDYFIAALIAIFKNWRVLIGANLWKYKIFHWFFNAVGIPIEREKGSVAKRVEAVLKAKDFLSKNKKATLIVFPFGTRERHPEKGIYGFKAGAFNIACELGIPIIPVVLIGTNKWRPPSAQDTSSYNGKKQNLSKLVWSSTKQFFQTGISPTIAKVVYCNPISTFGKSPEAVMAETMYVMNKTYIKYTTRRHRRNKFHKTEL